MASNEGTYAYGGQAAYQSAYQPAQPVANAYQSAYAPAYVSAAGIPPAQYSVDPNAHQYAYSTGGAAPYQQAAYPSSEPVYSSGAYVGAVPAVSGYPQPQYNSYNADPKMSTYQHQQPAPVQYYAGGAGPAAVQGGMPSYHAAGVPHAPQPGANAAARFQPSRQWNDLWAAVLFFASIIATIIILATKYSSSDFTGGSNASTELGTSKWGGIFIVTFLIATAMAISWLQVLKSYARELIIGTNVLAVLFLASFSIFMFANGATFAGFMFLISAIFNAIWLYSCRDRIPFAQLLLESAATIVKAFPATITTAFVGLAVQALYLVLWFYAFAAVLRAGSGGLQFLLILFFYWTMQVISGVIQVTVAGLSASWYFAGGSIDAMPGNPTKAALKRACTTSFGSICFGSLLIAIIRTALYFARSARNNRNTFVACIVTCLLNILENLVQFFNRFAFTQIAIYGKDFKTAAKDTWEMLKSSGLEALIQENFAGPVIFLSSLLGGLVAGLIGGLWAHSTAGGSWYAVALLCFLMGLVVFSVVLSTVHSAITTIFVCFAEEPFTLQRINPDLYSEFAKRNGAPTVQAV